MALALAQLVIVIFAFPALMALILPLAFTLSTFGLLDLKMTFLFEDFVGVKMTLTLAVAPIFRL